MPHYGSSVPTAQELGTHAGWWRAPGTNRFLTVRRHFHLIDRGLDGEVYYGDVVADLTTPGDATTTVTFSVTKEIEVVDERSTLERFVVGHFSLDEIQTTLGAGLGAGGFDLDAAVEGHLLDETRTECAREQSAHHVRRISSSETFTQESEVKGGQGRVFAVRAYHRHLFDLYLSYYDFLSVDVKRHVGRHAKVQKHPRPPTSSGSTKWYERRPNVRKPVTYLGSVSFFQPLPTPGFPIFKEADYTRTVTDPDALIIDPDNLPTKVMKHPPPPKDDISLYDLAETFRRPKGWFSLLPPA